MDIPGINPYIFHIGPLGVRWYGFFMAISMAVAIFFFVRAGRRRGLSEDFLYNVSLVGIMSGVVGARLLYVLTNPGYFQQFPSEIIRIDHGGLSIHGALLGGVLGVAAYARRYRVPVSPLLDWAVPGVAVGIALVRIGNIFNREILGHPAAILGGARHPAQLYGSAIGILLLLLYFHQSRRETPDGYRFWTFVAVYTALRGAVEETFRDNPLYLVQYVNEEWGVGFMTLTQWVTLPILAFAVYMLVRAKRLNLHWRPEPGHPAAEALGAPGGSGTEAAQASQGAEAAEAAAGGDAPAQPEDEEELDARVEKGGAGGAAGEAPRA
ncbi:MAG: prolipoprotein diacylglyceryl transferase [Firmicutes bacterium]|nr:prolipoprotein diacylglyceryl transferase [Bacillota bacterium]